MHNNPDSLRKKQHMRRFLSLFVTISLVISSFAFDKVSAYYTVGALGRSLNVYSGFTVNRTLLAPMAPDGVEGCREGQLLHDFAGVTIHETSNWSANANALMHAQYLRGGGQYYDVSWHYAVDSTSAYQSIPEYEKAWHAGDTAQGKGNAQTIAIEICDNSNGNFDQAMANAEWLAADILYRHGVYNVNGYLFQHNQFSAYGKNCPITIRDTGRWPEFCAKTQGFLDGMVAAKGVGTPILMTSTATVDQAKNWAASHNASPAFIMLADLYWELAPQSGVNPAAAYAQSAHETAFGRFGGVIDATYNNPCGMKTSAGGDNYDPAAHQRFSSWREGVKAHIDHLALYAGQLGYPKTYSTTTPDPRHFSFLFGTAATLESLGGKWAPSLTYGSTVAGNMRQIQVASTEPYLLDAMVTSIDIISYSSGTVTADITAKNTGSTTWTEDIQTRLGFGIDAADKRQFLPAGVEVKAGQTYTFRVSLPITYTTAPHRFVACMIRENDGWIGVEYSQEIAPLAAKVLSFKAPEALLIAQTASIQITMENTGLTSWTTDQKFRLATTYARISMAAGSVVDPGETYTFTAGLSAPSLPGTQVINLQMVKEGVAFFGEKKALTIPVEKPTAAEISSIVLSQNIKAGEPFTALITAKNTGKVTWTSRDNIRLGISGTASKRLLLPENTAVAPGESYVFTYSGTAPLYGDLNVTARMIMEGVCWFGASKTATVYADNAAVVSVSAPSALIISQTLTMSVKVKNTGLSTWTASDGFRFAATDERVSLPDTAQVAPGEYYTFTADLQATQTVGTKTVNLQMVQEGDAFFGKKKVINIPVKKPAAAEITSIVLSGKIKAGGSYTAQITVKNTDNVFWTSKDRIRLGISGAGSVHLSLPAGTSIAPGSSYTFTYNGTAPSKGNLVLSVQMLMENVCWFGEKETAQVLSEDALITSVSQPPVLLPGQIQLMTVTVKNTGLSTWTAAGGFRLATNNSDTVSGRSMIAAGTTVAPGETYAFNVNVKAPLTAGGQAAVNLQMVKEGAAYFGAKNTAAIPVKKPDASLITAITLAKSDAETAAGVLPESIRAGESFTAQITVQNTDFVIWTKQAGVCLGITGTASGPSRLYLPDDAAVAPGESYTFSYSGTAPAAGDLTLTARMLQSGVTWFGDRQTATAKENNAEIVSVSTPIALLYGQTQAVTVTVKNTGIGTWTPEAKHRLSMNESNTTSTRSMLAADTAVAPGEEYTFTITVKAPALGESGQALLNLRMVKEGVAFFGETRQISIPLKTPAAAQVTATTLPDTLAAGTQYPASVTVKNTDNVIWDSTAKIRLGYKIDGKDTGRLASLPAGTLVHPGESYEFIFTFTAGAAGTYSFSLLQEGVRWFGDQISRTCT